MSQLGNTIINGAARVNGVLTANSAAIPSITGNLNGIASNATVATSLSTSAGSTTQPIYFSGGKPVAITGAIANNTTGNAGSASKLSVNANTGSSSQPVYFSNGVPVAITGTLSNNAATATKLQSARKISITGSVTASGVSFDGSGDISLNTTVASVAPNTITAGNINANVNVLGTANSANNLNVNTTTSTSAYPILFHSISNVGSAAVYKTANATLTKDGALSVTSANISGSVKVGSNWTITKSGSALVFTYA